MKFLRSRSLYRFLAIFFVSSLVPFALLRWWWLALTLDVVAYLVVGLVINVLGELHNRRIVLFWLPVLLFPGLDWVRIIGFGGKGKP